MIEVKLLDLNSDNTNIKLIITNPKLWELNYGQGENLEIFEVPKDYQYVGIFWGSRLIGLFQFRSMNGYTVETHVFILPQYWGSGASIEATHKGHKWLLDNTQYRSIFTTVPLECKHVHYFLAQVQYKVTGNIPNGIIYNNKQQDLIIYTKHLNKEEQI